jgi:hypothetical protein
MLSVPSIIVVFVLLQKKWPGTHLLERLGAIIPVPRSLQAKLSTLASSDPEHH